MRPFPHAQLGGGMHAGACPCMPVSRTQWSSSYSAEVPAESVISQASSQVNPGSGTGCAKRRSPSYVASTVEGRSEVPARIVTTSRPKAPPLRSGHSWDETHGGHGGQPRQRAHLWRGQPVASETQTV